MNRDGSNLIRFERDLYQIIRTMAKANNRTIGQQANWICKIALYIEENHHEVYAEAASHVLAMNLGFSGSGK